MSHIALGLREEYLRILNFKFDKISKILKKTKIEFVPKLKHSKNSSYPGEQKTLCG